MLKTLFYCQYYLNKAQVITIDLPSDSNDFINSYKRTDKNNLKIF